MITGRPFQDGCSSSSHLYGWERGRGVPRGTKKSCLTLASVTMDTSTYLLLLGTHAIQRCLSKSMCEAQPLP